MNTALKLANSLNVYNSPITLFSFTLQGSDTDAVLTGNYSRTLSSL